jgi:hypothetical protein
LDATEARAQADKAKADAAGIEDLRKRLHTAETSLSDYIAGQSAREEAILKRVTTQSRRFVGKYHFNIFCIFLLRTSFVYSISFFIDS